MEYCKLVDWPILSPISHCFISEKRLKTVYFEMAGRTHSAFRSLLKSPPEGYTFISKDYYRDLGVNRSFWLRNRLDSAFGLASYTGLPIKLLRSLFTPLHSPPSGTELTIMNGILDLRPEKWMVIVEEALSSFLGINVDNKIFHGIVEKQLSNVYCKGAICFFNAAANSIRATYDVSNFEDKIYVVPPAIESTKISRTVDRKKNGKQKTTILVLGSANFWNKSGIYIKGMHIALKAYLKLRKEIPNVELIIHGAVPPDLASKTSLFPDIHMQNRLLNPAELKDLFLKSDIYLAPSFTTPWISYLEAMNYELPIVTTNTNANSEIVRDGINGFVVEVPRDLEPIINNFSIPDRSTHKKIMQVWLRDNDMIVDNLVNAIRILVKQPDLAKNMGKRGKEDIEGGIFSIRRRNAVLKNVLDRAIS